MNKFINTWRLAIIKGANGYLVSILAILCATDLFSPRWRLIIAAFCAGHKFLDGFIDQTINNIKQNHDPVGLKESEIENAK